VQQDLVEMPEEAAAPHPLDVLVLPPLLLLAPDPVLFSEREDPVHERRERALGLLERD
jgi:hypothetical protein